MAAIDEFRVVSKMNDIGQIRYCVQKQTADPHITGMGLSYVEVWKDFGDLFASKAEACRRMKQLVAQADYGTRVETCEDCDD